MSESIEFPIENTVEYALELFDSHFTWAESVLLAVSKATGQNDPCIPGIAKGFAVGLGGKGEICGAVSGGVLALGLLYGEDFEVGPKTSEFVQGFAEENGGLRCIDLLDLEDCSIEELLISARNLKTKVCDGLVTSAVEVFLAQLDDPDNQKWYRGGVLHLPTGL